DPIFDLVRRGQPIRARPECRDGPVMVVRVQAARPLFQIVGEFVIVVTEHAFPARRGVILVGYYVPIPESVAGAAHRKFEPLLASAKGGDVAAHGVDQRLTRDAVGGPRDPALPTV